MIAGDEIPRTLIVDLAQGFGGTSSRVLRLLSELPASRVELAALETGAIAQRAQALGFPVHVVGRSKADPRVVGRLVRIIREGEFKLVDTQNIQSKFWGSMAAVRARAGLVSTINSWYEAEHGGSLKGRIYQAIELATNHELDMYIVVSSEHRTRLLRAGIPESRIQVILNAVEIDPSAVGGGRDWLCATFGLPPDAIVCCAVGRLVPAKDYPLLIRAMKEALAYQPRLYALIVGGGPLRDSLASQIARAGLQERVRLLGFRDREETLSIIKSSDLFVMSSSYEGTPVALLEAAALARPIVATRAGGIPDLVTHGTHAHLVDGGDAIGLAAGLIWVCDHPEEAAYLGQQARQHVVDNFNPRRQAEATMRAYQLAYANYRQRIATQG